MTFGAATYAVGLAAGALSTLSPCVLPLVPILIASALNAHRFGPAALGVGLALSFTAIGILRATAGASLQLDADTFRIVGAMVLAAFGAVLLLPRLQTSLAGASGSLSDVGNRWLARCSLDGLPGQFLVGLVLGVVWSPCVGPTLGAATTLASQGSDLAQIALLMLVFGLGAAAPLVFLGVLSRSSLLRVRGHLLQAGRYGKQLLGLWFVGLAVLILTGADRHVEAWLLEHSPEWLTALTTRL
jgi:cytochrome c-type biogenesis protein